MKEILEKSVGRTITIISLVIAVYFGFGCNKNFIVVLFSSIYFSFSIIYIWHSFHSLKDKEKLKKDNIKLLKEIKEHKKEIEKIYENNKGLKDERENYKRKIDRKDDKIYFLEMKVKELQIRVITNERND